MTNAPDESGRGGMLKPRRNVDKHTEGGGWIRVCRQRIEFTTRFLRRPIVAGFNSDSFSTRHIKFMACTVHITHPPEGEHATTTERMRNHHPLLRFFFPLFPFSRLFSPGHLREWIFRRVFPLPSPSLEPCSIFTTSTFSPAIFAAPRNTTFHRFSVVARIRDDRLSKIPAIVKNSRLIT